MAHSFHLFRHFVCRGLQHDKMGFWRDKDQKLFFCGFRTGDAGFHERWVGVTSLKTCQGAYCPLGSREGWNQYMHD
jgi:hypothetical protein